MVGMADISFVERKRWVFLGLPWTFTKYTVREDMITRDTGFLNKEENDCYMYKVIDVILKESFMERIFKLGTVVCVTSDATDGKLELRHIRNAKAIKNYILDQSEKERIRRRTVNTLNIGIDADLDGDGIADSIQ